MSAKYSVIFVFALFLFPLTGQCQSAVNNSAREIIHDSSFEIKELNLVVENNKEAVPYKEFSNWIKIEPILKYKNGYKTEAENIHHCAHSIFCDFTKNWRDRYKVKKTVLFSVKPDTVRTFLENTAGKINKNPINAKFKAEDEKVIAFSLSEKGLRIDIEKSIETVSNTILENEAASLDVNLIYEILEPEINSKDANKLGITSLIGEGRSNFKGSTKSRIHNIKIASACFNGALIKPKEEFSFINTLGEVDGKHGYLQELVIKHNKTEPAFGGGICQVSTTAFRAAIFSGLKITIRRPHAYPVHYYNPQGLDATVYLPRPDLRFINNTPNHILIQTKIEGLELIFQFYGIDDGRKIETDGPKIIQRNSDGSMKTTFTQKVYDAQGNIVIDDIFNSAYDSPNKYPQPGQEIKLTEKPKDWPKKQWKEYKKANGI